MLIGLLSDTHGSFDAPLRSFFSEVDQIWHAGDFGNIETAETIAAFKPLVGVYGNCDGHKVRLSYPLMQFFEVEQVKVLMTHIGGFPNHWDYAVLSSIKERRPDLFICGHSHILKVMQDKKFKMLCVNPGAAGNEGIHIVRTAVRFKIDAGKISDMEVWEKAR
ncbi:MAG: metallophosphatase family protein [Prevotellaceae bacterium]|jgi:putative phosphoesterase|nr:metallophosphatase family protein [Prevotellaceae bacterium]